MSVWKSVGAESLETVPGCGNRLDEGLSICYGEREHKVKWYLRSMGKDGLKSRDGVGRSTLWKILKTNIFFIRKIAQRMGMTCSCFSPQPRLEIQENQYFRHGYGNKDDVMKATIVWVKERWKSWQLKTMF